MNIGLFPFITDYSMPLDRLAVAAEERGFDSIWVPEHTHIPASRNTAYPGGGDLPKEYSHTLDPFVALGIAAGVTTKLKLATGICLAIEHQVITLAKTVATLDHVSGGRVLLGLGAVEPLDEGERPRVEARAEVDVDEVHARRADADANRAGTRRSRVVRLAGEHLRSAGLAHEDRPGHASSPSSA